MMRSLFSGVSGLRNHQTRMDVIGNNIANVNTVGFKGSRVQFQDVLSQTITGAASAQGNRGGTNPMQVGLGMGLASIDTIFTDGSFQPTGKGTDLSIQGQGFFVLANGAQQIYTRAGNFDFDTAGNYLVPGTGYKVMGWMADAAGNINTAGNVTSIQIPVGATMPARASTSVTFENNLSASDLANATTQTSRDVYDSLGNKHKVNTVYTKLTDNTWLAVSTVPDAIGPVTGATKLLTFNPSSGALVSVQDATAAAGPTTTLTFQSLRLDPAAGAVNKGTFSVREASGAYRSFDITYTRTSATTWDYTITDPTGGTVTNPSGVVTYATPPDTYDFSQNSFSFTDGAGATQTVQFNAPAGTPVPGAATVAGQFSQQAVPLTGIGVANSLAFTPTGGGVAMSVNLDMSTLTQNSGESTVQATGTNGYTAGTLSSTTIDPSGIIVGRFSNGQSKNLGQVALATFNNPAGLNKVGENLFAESNNSGVAQVGTSGTGGRGKFNPGTLEMANVDLANEFSNMIITQRGFQANSKIITVTDEMLQELANLKR